MRIVWKHEGTKCRVRGCDGVMSSGHWEVGDLDARGPRQTDLDVKGPVGHWECDGEERHSNYIFRDQCTEVVKVPGKRSLSAPGLVGSTEHRNAEGPLPPDAAPLSTKPTEEKTMTTTPTTPEAPKKTKTRKKTPEPVYISKVTSNIKSREAWSTELGPKTIIVGPNGSGKSAHVNAIELALTKRVSDVAGRRTLAKPIELLTLGTPGEVLTAELQLSNGTRATCQIQPKEGGGAKTPAHMLPDGVDLETVLTVRPLTEAVLGNPATARKFFLAQAETVISDMDVIQRIREPRQQDYSQAVDKAPKDLGAVQKLLWVIELARRQKSNLDRDKLAQEGYLSAAAGRELILPTEAQFAGLTEAIQAEESRIQDGAWQHWTERIAQADSNLTVLHNALGKVQGASGQKEVVAAVELILGTAVRKGLQACPLCETPVGGRLQEQYAAFREMAAGLVDPTVDVGGAPMAEGAIRQLIQQWEADKAFGVRWQADNEQHGTMNIAPSDRLQELRGQLQQIEDQKRLWEGQAGAREKISVLSEQIGRWSDLGMACEGAVKSLLESTTAVFEKKVQGFLPKGDVFSLQLDDNGRDVFRMGFLGSGIASSGDTPFLRTALSGAEWARLMVALASACASGGKVEGGKKQPAPLQVLIPEERAYDPVTLQSILKALQKAPGQVILTSPVPPKGHKLKAWTYVVLEGAKVEKGKGEGGAEAGGEADDNGAGESTDLPPLMSEPLAAE